ncbi:type I-B CRISPR-associated protein Cas8b1/Cst1, partial [bacterium]|nr:type I-B CRISPR-associated protein Cas8b1/Cst1 [bacterium]
MYEYTGHPLVDVGIATICAFAGKSDPSTLTIHDLDNAADYMEENYIVDPLKSFLSVVFTSNSGLSQPAYNKQPEKRKEYAKKVLRAYKSSKQISDMTCVFTGKPAVDLSLDLRDELPRGYTFRQHFPILTGENVTNFFPYGKAGLPVSGLALLAIHALPLCCAK